MTVQMQTTSFTEKVFNLSVRPVNPLLHSTISTYPAVPETSGIRRRLGLFRVHSDHARLFPASSPSGVASRQAFSTLGANAGGLRAAPRLTGLAPANALALGIVGAVSFSNKPQLQSETQQYMAGAGSPIVFTTQLTFANTPRRPKSA